MAFQDTLEKKAEQMFQSVFGWEQKALIRIGKRVKKIGSLSYADLQAINNAAIVKQDVEVVMKELAELTGQNVREVQQMYNDMISIMHEDKRTLYDYRNKPFVPFADNKELQAITRAFARTTAETFVNLSMTKANRIGFVDKTGKFNPIDKAFKEVIDKAVMSVSTGTGDYNSEMLDVLRQLGGSGVRVDYGGGITRSLDSMVRQNVLWGAKQTAKEYEHIIGDELGCDGIEIDWHSNPRLKHEFMQGKQFILGKARIVNGIYFESADKALEALNDYGCLHFETRIICGVSEPTYSPEELRRLNEENNRLIEIDGVSKKGYEWKQTMRRLERAGKETKLKRETFKAAGNNTEARNQSQRLKAIEEKYQLIADKTGIKAQPERMSIINNRRKFIGNESIERNFRAVEINSEESLIVKRKDITITANKLLNTHNEMYISNKTTLKPKQQHFLDKNISKAKKIMGISNDEKLSQILIVDSSEMNLGVLASYNPVDDVLRIDSRLSIKEQIPILQKEGVFPENETSTLIHELYHWRDAQKYKLKFGNITKDNVNSYFAWVDNNASNSIDKLEKINYDIKSISEYARKSYKKRAFDEVYTEYRTLVLLGGE